MKIPVLYKLFFTYTIYESLWISDTDNIILLSGNVIFLVKFGHIYEIIA